MSRYEVLPSASLLDDLDEWAQFSRRIDPATCPSGSSSAPTAVSKWESQALVRGVYCTACSLAVEQALLAVPAVISTNVSAASARASVVWTPATTRPSLWMAAPTAAGYSLVPAADAFEAGNGRQDARLPVTVQAPMDAATPSCHPITFTIAALGDAPEAMTEKSVFLVPR